MRIRVYNDSMRPISTTELPAMTFSLQQSTQKFNVQGNKIGWVRAMTEKPGFSFDLTIKDSLGRVRAQRQNCKTETTEFGELMNLPTNLGENLEFEVSNIKGAEKVTIFAN